MQILFSERIGLLIAQNLQKNSVKILQNPFIINNNDRIVLYGWEIKENLGSDFSDRFSLNSFIFVIVNHREPYYFP